MRSPSFVAGDRSRAGPARPRSPTRSGATRRPSRLYPERRQAPDSGQDRQGNRWDDRYQTAPGYDHRHRHDAERRRPRRRPRYDHARRHEPNSDRRDRARSSSRTGKRPNRPTLNSRPSARSSSIACEAQQRRQDDHLERLPADRHPDHRRRLASQVLSTGRDRASTQTTGVQLHGGVGTPRVRAGSTLGLPDLAQPGRRSCMASSGTRRRPSRSSRTIRIDHIYDTAYRRHRLHTPAAPRPIPTGPLTSPTVTLWSSTAMMANVRRRLDRTQEPNLVHAVQAGRSTAASTVIPTQIIPTDTRPRFEYQFPIVGTTGRTCRPGQVDPATSRCQRRGDQRHVLEGGPALPEQPDRPRFSVGAAAVRRPRPTPSAIDARGSIKSGSSSPRGSATRRAPTTTAVASSYGTNLSAANGYRSFSGLVGGQIVTEGNIGQRRDRPEQRASSSSMHAGSRPRSSRASTADGPLISSGPATALTTSRGGGGWFDRFGTHIVGDLTKNSEVKSGYNYYSAIGGSEGVTGASSIGPVNVRGNIVDSVISASYRPNDGVYGNGNDTAGDGTITGKYQGQIYKTNTGATVLGNKGAGFYARYTSAHPSPRRRPPPPRSDPRPISALIHVHRPPPRPLSFGRRPGRGMFASIKSHGPFWRSRTRARSKRGRCSWRSRAPRLDPFAPSGRRIPSPPCCRA